MTSPPGYLDPYLRSTRQHGSGFKSLLWASPSSQRARFEAIRRIASTGGASIEGASVVDAGCGRADLLAFLTSHNVHPLRYVGVEAVPELAAAARAVADEVVEADFVQQPEVLDRDTDYIVFCGSLNTMRAVTFMLMIGHAHRFARRGVIFNFLTDPSKAGAPYLTWHKQADVLAFARSLSPRVTLLDDYLFGDATLLLERV